MLATSTARALSPARVGRFLRAQWRWALLVPALVVLGTVLHEGAHALTVLAVGGTLYEVHLLPGMGEGGFTFGWVRHDTPEPGLRLVRLAPFLAAHVHAALGGYWSARLPLGPGRVLFFTSALLPLIDASMLYAGLVLRSRRADLGVFADAPWPLLALFPLFVGGCVLASQAFHRHWPGDEGLSPEEFQLGLWLVLALPWLRFLTVTA